MSKTIKEEIRRILAPNKFGVKCPFCKFEPTPYLTLKGRKRGVIQHVLKRHPQKLLTREQQFISLFETSLAKAVKEERQRIIKELKNGAWLVYIKNDIVSLISAEEGIKIRRQMRREIIDWLKEKEKI